jgi:DNA-binding protein YbaB
VKLSRAAGPAILKRRKPYRRGDAVADLSDLDRMLTETRKLLGQAQPGTSGEPAEGRGSAADGRIRVVAGPGGEITSIELDPRVMRMASQELAEHLTEAVNQALRELRAQATTADTAIPPEVLAQRLAEVQDQGLRQMAVFTQSLQDVMARLGRRAEDD